MYLEFNEWEIVIWDPCLCHCVAIRHIYCNCKTQQAYHLCNLDRMVQGQPTLHKEGKYAIFMVDSSSLEMQGLGDFLLTQNDPLFSIVVIFARYIANEGLNL
ncbi:hypothetical protein BU17DRAFT_65266 [Hysterangium stoloniferum]|nr:hypothetical protein BU17DRAFT_65266 [Hysterangium stoloniferum]